MGAPAKFRSARMLAAIAAFLTSTGCARAVDAGLAMAGAKAQGGAAPTLAARPKQATTSTYEYTPRRTWGGDASSAPYRPHYTIFDRMGWNSCTIQPEGVSRVLPVAEGPGAAPLYTLGPLEAGVAGIPVLEARALFREGSGGLAQRMMERTGRNATIDGGCGHSIFLYIGLAGSAGSQPVIVSR